MVDRIEPLLGEPDNEKDNAILRAFTVSANIAYARCFVDGTRSRLAPGVVFADFVGDEPLKWHQNFIDTRHKHTAHSENVFEESVAGCIGTKDGELIGATSAHLFRTGDSKEGNAMLRRLAEHSHAYVMKKVTELNGVLLAEASAMSAAERLALPRLNFSVELRGRPDVAALAERRSQDRKAGKKKV